MDPLFQVFEKLDRWRHLPGYQLERRADIFFSVYLKDVVEEVTGVPLDDEIIPELPLRRDLVLPHRATPTSSRLSVNVDYALFAKDRSRVYFVELKTDMGSRRDQQDEYLEAAKCVGFRQILEGICSIAVRTKAKQKYVQLLFALARLGYLSFPDELEAYVFPRPRRGVTKLLEQVAPLPLDPAVDVLYVQPARRDGADDVIDFATFAEHVGRHDDPVSLLFAEHLGRWRSRAGACPPP